MKIDWLVKGRFVILLGLFCTITSCLEKVGTEVKQNSDYWNSSNRSFAFRNENELKDYINRGYNINATDDNNDGVSLLHNTIYLGQVNMVKIIAAAGADLNIKTKDGFTPLHWAMGCEPKIALEIAKILIEAGALINPVNNYGRTPLDIAKDNKRKETYEFLLKNGAKLGEAMTPKNKE